MLAEHGHLIEVATLATPCPPAQVHSPHAVKVVADTKGRALYFSRAAIPFDRDGVGFAGYMKHLSFLQNGIAIHVSQTPYDTRGVDTEEDLAAVEAVLAQRLD